jgi:hypothetical protein
MLQDLVVISQKFYYRKETYSYAKVIRKKEKRKKIKLRKNGQVSDISKTMGTPMPV